MDVITQLVDFWSNLLYGLSYTENMNFADTTLGESIIQDLPKGNADALGTSFQNFMFYFFNYLPYMFAFLTLGLAVFLFCFMMYKIIKLFTNAF